MALPQGPFTDPHSILSYDPQFLLSELVAPILAPLSLALFLAKTAQSAPFLASGPQNWHRIFPNCTPLKKPEWPALPATVTQSRRRP